MKIKTILITSMLGLGVVQTGLATSVCPSINAIQAAGFNRIAPMSGQNNWYAAQLKNKYGTDIDWSFVIFFIPGKDVNEATMQAKKMLSELNSAAGPLETSFGTACTYKIGTVAGALALTPPYKNSVFNLSSLVNH